LVVVVFVVVVVVIVLLLLVVVVPFRVHATSPAFVTLLEAPLRLTFWNGV